MENSNARKANNVTVKVGDEVIGTMDSLESIALEPNSQAKEILSQVDTVKQKRKEAKERAKEEAKAKEYWNTMITRREAYEMVQETYANLAQQFQLLMVQNTTLLEIMSIKGVATAEEINEHSKQVIESMFGPIPTEGGEDNVEPSSEPESNQ